MRIYKQPTEIQKEKWKLLIAEKHLEENGLMDSNLREKIKAKIKTRKVKNELDRDRT